MNNYKMFVYVFTLKSNVVTPKNYGQLSEEHYICVHREPVVELIDREPAAVVHRMRCLGMSPVWYKRGLKTLKPPDVIWYEGIGYMLVSEPARLDGQVCHNFKGLFTHKVKLAPEKVLACKV